MYGDPEKRADSAEGFLAALAEPRRADIAALHDRVRAVAPEMSVSAAAGMLAYGRYAYRYASGREGEWFCLGIASNKAYISVYAPTIELEPFVDRLPKANLGRGCIRFKRLADIDVAVIDEVIRASAANDGRTLIS
jgi:hypothetical protein